MIGLIAAAEGAAFSAEQWSEFYARLHPVLLHFPIGLTVAALFMELVALVSPGARSTRRWMYGLLALSAAFAASSGWLLGEGSDYSSELVDEHRRLGVAAAILAAVVVALDLVGRSRRAAAARGFLALLCAGVIGTAGHHGGMITHGRTFLSSAAPPWLAPYLTEGGKASRLEDPAGETSPPAVAPTESPVGVVSAGSFAVDAPADAADPLSGFADPLSGHGENEGAGVDLELLVSTFRARCFECHNEDKTKGGLRLDELAGWEDGVDLESPEDSELLYRVLLPRDDVDAMPPKGKGLDKAAIEALQGWIEAGAPTGELRVLLGEAAEDQEKQAASMDELREASGARIEPIAEDLLFPMGQQRLDVSWRHSDASPSVGQVRALAPIAGRVVNLDLARSGVTDATVRGLPEMEGLTRLHLESTGVTDVAMSIVAERAPSLEYLNLHSTGVTGGGLDAIGRLVHLQRLVLFGTSVTPAQADGFSSQAPQVKVTIGAPAPEVFANGQPRRILAADASKGRVVLLREVAIGRPDVLWERPIQALHDLQWLGETGDGHGRVLVQESWTKIVEVDTRTGETLWSYDARPADGERVEIHSFQRLDDGTTMVAESGRGRIAFVNGAGELTGTIALTLERPDPHHDTRLVRVTPKGTFLVAHENDGVVLEYDRSGAVVWTFEVPLFGQERAAGHGPEGHGNQCFQAIRRADGDTLVTTGNGSSLLCVSPEGDVRWRKGSEDLDGIELAWVTTVQELEDGHLVLGNCHAGDQQPQAIELGPDFRVEWTFRDFERFGNGLSNLLVIEDGR